VQPQATIQLSQVIELGGKRAARQHLATLNRDLAAWDYETARIDVLTEVTRAFTDVLAAQETVALTEQTTRLVEQVQQSVGARVVAGVVSPIEETRATVALAGVRVESARARRTLEASRTRLALLWGSPAPAFKAVVGNLRAEPAALPAMSDLTARIEQSPELARWAAEMSQREAAFAVERSKGVPDVSVVAGYRRFTDIDSNALLVGASIPLPFFDRNRGAIEEARSRLAKAHEERRAVQARVAAALAEAYAALASAHDEVTALRSAVLPGSQQTFAAVSEGYRLGKFGYLDVLDAQRTLIGAGSQYLRALSDYHKAIANVERLIGAPLAGSMDLPTTARE
jgi:outer membrane protein, heavy metal efflux system